MQKRSLLALTSAFLISSLAVSASALKLPAVDCSKSQDARCRNADIGKVGQGLPFYLGGYTTIGSGYVDAASNTLYVPVELGNQQDNQGVVMAVDLATGNRRVVSGYDGEEWIGKGQDYVDGSGRKATAYDLGRVEAVRPGPGGSILALVDKGLQARSEIFSIDPRTGDRALVWASKVFPDSARDGATSIRTIESSRVGGEHFCRSAGDDRVGLKPSETFEADGQYIYLFMPNQPSGTGIGLMRYPLAGGKCEWVSQYWPDGTGDVGSGPTINTLSPLVMTSAMVGGEFLAATGPNPGGNVLFGIKTAGGARRTVSALSQNNPARRKGEGADALGYSRRMAVTGDLLLTLGSEPGNSSFEPVLIDLRTGNRSAVEAKSGSLKGVGRDSNANIVAGIPGTTQFIVAFDKGLHVLDVKTGQSYLLSK